MADQEETQAGLPLIESQDMAVVPVQTSERRLSAVVSVNNQQLLVVGWVAHTIKFAYKVTPLHHARLHFRCNFRLHPHPPTE